MGNTGENTSPSPPVSACTLARMKPVYLKKARSPSSTTHSSASSSDFSRSVRAV